MNFLLKVTRVCVPLSLDCNLHCKYCYRDKEKLDSIPAFTEDMISYLGSLKPDKCECVCASGGEPLMHWDKVKEFYVKQRHLFYFIIIILILLFIFLYTKFFLLFK